MANAVEQSIDVRVPISTVYNQWTQFESFPRFMEGIEEVRQLDDKHVHWRANISGQEKEWDAEITEQIPDDRVAWRSTSGAGNAGVVSFHHVGPEQTRVMLQMEYDTEGMKEKVGDMLGVAQRRIKGDLERFKDYIESRGVEEGGWRGEIHRPGT
jgi:uncharacterized membrane protein